MGYFTGNFSARSNFQLQLNTSLSSQSIPGNYSVVNWSLYIVKTSGAASYHLDNNCTWAVNIGGTGFSGVFSYDFRAYTTLLLGSGSVVIYHNPDGTGSFSSSASANAISPLGTASASGSDGLPTIPRASLPTFSPNPVEAGSSVTITTNRASSGFTHTLEYTLGSDTGTIATGVGASTTWTPPLSLLNQIPNSTSGVISIKTTTYSGATVIGTSTTALTLTVPASVVPDFTTVTNSEATTGLAALVGAYVQGLTTLNLALTGAVGAYNSTISSYKITVGGQTLNAATGTTTPITVSGTVPIVGTVTDSRGRTTSKTVNITVLAYAPPSIDSDVFQTRRSDAAGVLAEEGTYIRVDLKAAVQSLIVSSTQKNSLTYKISTRERGDTTWTLKKTVTPAGVTFNSFDTVGTYAVENSWDVQVIVSDKFNSAVIQSTVATSTIFQHWGEGLGVGKFWEQGGLDVKGQIYQNDGDPVVSLSLVPGALRPSLQVSNPTFTVINADTLTDTGWYSGYQWAGPLAGFGIGAVEVIQYSVDWISQTFHQLDASANVYTRARHSGTTWSPWKRVVHHVVGGGPAFHARLTSKSMSGAATASKIIYDQVDLNKGSCYNASTGRFIAPVSGLYTFEVAMTQTTNVDGPIAYFYKNGSGYPTAYPNGESIMTIAYYFYLTSSGTRTIELVAGDYIEIFLTNANGVTIVIGGYGNHFSGHLIEAY